MLTRLVLVAIIWQVFNLLTGMENRQLLAAGMGDPAAQPLAKAGWQLTRARVVREGTTSRIDTGTVVNGYTIEAEAVAVGDTPFIPKGKFTLMVMAFSPDKDLQEQKAGRWYLKGSWNMVEEKAAKGRHIPVTIKGDLSADLPFNPLTGQGEVDARVKLPRITPPSRWASGEGGFSGNEKFEGTMTITLNPRMQAKKQSAK